MTANETLVPTYAQACSLLERKLTPFEYEEYVERYLRFQELRRRNGRRA